MAVERLARELFDVAYPGVDWNGHPGSHFIRLAHHVLRRERAARGRTIGRIQHYCGEWRVTHDRGVPVFPNFARIVAVPKPRKGGRK